MKLKNLMVGVVLSCALGASAANARIVIQSPLFNGSDVCSGVAGTWVGTGNASASGVKCKYKGVAFVTQAGDEHTYNLIIDLTKTSGLLCPKDEHLEYMGTCENGMLVIEEEDANLSGTTDGHTAYLAGTVELLLGGVPVNANVDMHLTKK